MIRKDLPILIVSGSDDPVGDYGKGVETAYKLYKDAGIKDVQMKLYEGDRHEILNELDRQQVYQDLLEWLQSKMPEPTEEITEPAEEAPENPPEEAEEVPE